MASERSVLIVDRSEENREVLEIALSRRGLRTLATGRVESGLELARRHQPDLIVLDLETDDSTADEVSGPFFRQSAASGTPVVMLGTIRRTSAAVEAVCSSPIHRALSRMNAATTNGAGTTCGASAADQRRGEFVAKPYHYGPLIRKIEKLLDAHRCQNPRSEI